MESTLPDGPGPVPDDAWSEERITRLFEEANARPSTPAERRLLRQLAAATDPAAGGEGWAWLGHAIDDAVAAGSTFVAPRRLREILTRWGRDGLPAEYAPHGAAPSPVPDAPVTRPGSSSHRSERTPAATPKHAEPAPAVPVFTIEACGMTNRQVWAAVLADLQLSGAIGRAELSTWLRDAAVVGVATDGGLVIGLPHELAQRRAAGRYQAAIRQAVERVTGIAFAITFVLSREWAA